jgi:hypothetical protein
VARELPGAGVTPDAPGAQAIGNTAIAASATTRFRVNEIIGVLSKGVAKGVEPREDSRLLAAWLQ